MALNIDTVRLPIGQSSFGSLRNNDCIYVDKTALIYEFSKINNGVHFKTTPF